MQKTNYFNEIIGTIKNNKLDKEKLSKLKVKLCKKHKLRKIPTDIEILLNSKIKDISKVKKYLLTKKRGKQKLLFCPMTTSCKIFILRQPAKVT